MNAVAMLRKKDSPGEGIKSEWRSITPVEARQMLTRNTTNRPLGPKAVADIVARMRDGRWVVTHQGIAFDNEGNLIDGQHRLQAIVDSGMPFMYQITYGLKSEVFDHTDINGKGARTASDLFARRIPGVKNRNNIVSIASVMLRGMDRTQHFSKEEVVDFAEKRHDLIRAVYEQVSKTPLRVPSSFYAAFCNAARDFKDPLPGPKGGFALDDVLIAAMRFAEQSWNGKGDPLKALQNRVYAEDREKGASGRATSGDRIYKLVVAALRAELNNKTLEKLQATEIDWGDKRDTKAIGTSAFVQRRSIASAQGWETAKKNRKTSAKLVAVAVAKPEPKRKATVVRRRSK